MGGFFGVSMRKVTSGNHGPDLVYFFDTIRKADDVNISITFELAYGSMGVYIDST